MRLKLFGFIDEKYINLDTVYFKHIQIVSIITIFDLFLTRFIYAWLTNIKICIKFISLKTVMHFKYINLFEREELCSCGEKLSITKILNYWGKIIRFIDFALNKPADWTKMKLWIFNFFSQASFMRTTWESCWPLWVIDSQTKKSTSSSEKRRSIKRATSTTWSSPVFLNTEPKTKTIKETKRPASSFRWEKSVLSGDLNPHENPPLTLIYWMKIKCLLCATHWNKISYFQWVMI